MNLVDQLVQSKSNNSSELEYNRSKQLIDNLIDIRTEKELIRVLKDLEYELHKICIIHSPEIILKILNYIWLSCELDVKEEVFIYQCSKQLGCSSIKHAKCNNNPTLETEEICFICWSRTLYLNHITSRYNSYRSYEKERRKHKLTYKVTQAIKNEIISIIDFIKL